MKAKQDKNLPSSSDVDKYERISPLLEALYLEITALSKKNPNDALNTLKIKMINRVLNEVKSFLETDPNVGFLELLDEATLPSNSDTVVIIGQFIAILSQFKARYHRFDGIRRVHRWSTAEDPIRQTT